MRVLLAAGEMRPEPGGVPLAVPGRGLGPGEVGAALAEGWRVRRPLDTVTLRTVPDGGPGSAQALAPGDVAARRVLHAAGPLGDVREVDLVRIARSGATASPGSPASRPSATPPAGTTPQAPSAGRAAATWYLDAARASALPGDRDVAAQEAVDGSSAGLGDLLGQALGAVPVGDTLVVGLARSAVHDGGSGALEALGGLQSALTLVEGREILLALADDVALGGMGGAGQGLQDITSLDPAACQDLDRRACAAAAALPQLVAAQSEPTRRALPTATGPRESLTVATWGTGAGGGLAMMLRALGARAVPGADLWADLLDVASAVDRADLVVTSVGEAYEILAGSVPAVVGALARRRALPCVLAAGRVAVPRGELAEGGITASYALEDLPGASGRAWDRGGAQQLAARITDLGSRLARTWSR